MKALKLLWAIPDHPWTDEGAAVRIAMTVGGLEGQPWLGRVVEERSADTPEAEAEGVKVEGRMVDVIHEDLSVGGKVSDALALKANDNLASRGMQLIGAFHRSASAMGSLGASFMRASLPPWPGPDRSA